MDAKFSALTSVDTSLDAIVQVVGFPSLDVADDESGQVAI